MVSITRQSAGAEHLQAMTARDLAELLIETNASSPGGDEVTALIRSGVFTKHRSDPSTTAGAENFAVMHEFAAYGMLEAMAILLDRGVDVDLEDLSGRTPLHFAAGANQLLMARLLIERGADANSMTQDGRTPLCNAIKSGYEEMVRLLVALGGDLRGAGQNPSPLHRAIEFRNAKLVELLLRLGADPYRLSQYSKWGVTQTPVQFAVAITANGAHIDILEAFIRGGVKFDEEEIQVARRLGSPFADLIESHIRAISQQEALRERIDIDPDAGVRRASSI